jgi:PPOX class probable F420-dependent enzyme
VGKSRRAGSLCRLLGRTVRKEASVVAGLDEFSGKKYLNLETYRKNGVGVRTPVWFAATPEDGGLTIYVYSTANSGKAKRIRRTGAVKIAPCDARGKVTGSWVEGVAKAVGGEEFDRGMRLLDRKYWPIKQLLNLSTQLFSRHQRVVIAIRPI